MRPPPFPALDQAKAHWREWLRDKIREGDGEFVKGLIHELMSDGSDEFVKSLDERSIKMIAQLAGTQLSESLVSLAEGG